MTKLASRPLGSSFVSAVSLGCMNLDHAYGDQVSEERGSRLLNRALDLGCTMLDTAAIYGDGENEKRLARAVMHRRQEFILASKCGFAARDDKRIIDGRPENLLATLEQSLSRLGTDHIDVYYLHRADPAVPIEESVGALARAREAGKIGAIGLSEISAEMVRRAHAIHPIVALQSEYSPWVRNPEIAVLDVCRDLGIAFVAFSPVGRGFFSGAIRHANYRPGDLRALLPRFQESNLSHNLELLDRFLAVAGDHGIGGPQLAIGWTLAQAPHVIALPGTVNEAHLAENLAAASLPIPDSAIAAVNAIFGGDAVAGARYPDRLQETVTTERFAHEQVKQQTAT